MFYYLRQDNLPSNISAYLSYIFYDNTSHNTIGTEHVVTSTAACRQKSVHFGKHQREALHAITEIGRSVPYAYHLNLRQEPLIKLFSGYISYIVLFRLFTVSDSMETNTYHLGIATRETLQEYQGMYAQKKPIIISAASALHYHALFKH